MCAFVRPLAAAQRTGHGINDTFYGELAATNTAPGLTLESHTGKIRHEDTTS